MHMVSRHPDRYDRLYRRDGKIATEARSDPQQSPPPPQPPHSPPPPHMPPLEPIAGKGGSF